MPALRSMAVAAAALGLVALAARLLLPSHADPTDDEFDLVSIFDGRALRPTTRSLRRGRAVTVFGGSSIDLRRAGLAGGRARLQVLSVFGGTEITVPDSWRVTARRVDVLGGSNVKATPDSMLDDDAPHLEVDAVSVFGGMAIVARPVIAAAEAG